MLRNVVHTGPWGQAGAHADLAEFLAYHVDPVAGLDAYKPDVALSDLPGAAPDCAILEDPAAIDALKASYDNNGSSSLSQDDIQALVAFLNALSDETSLEGRLGIPETVPSGLPVDR